MSQTCWTRQRTLRLTDSSHAEAVPGHLARRHRVRPASYARIDLGVATTGDAELSVEYLRYKRLLATECRPLAPGTDSIDIKTHPRSTHVRCIARSADGTIVGTRISLTDGGHIQPVGRHFIVIGAMKSGTTTLFRMLAQHAQLCQTWVEVPGVSSTKEINYFNKLYRKSHTPINYDWRFPFDPAKHAWTLDVSPNYAKLPKTRRVPRRIARLGGEVKLAYILRDPVDRVESQIAHSLRHDKVTSMGHCKRLSRYARHLDRFTEHIRRENILLLDFEQLKRNPAVTIAQICDFLGIDRIYSTPRVHNRREVNFRLTADQRIEIADAVRPDVQRLIHEYGFEAAERWLQPPRGSLLRLPPFKR